MLHLSPNSFFDRLREQHVKPYYFGLGFIQCKINAYERVHFYDPRVPSIMPYEEIHDHRYDFRSHVLFGSLRNDRYRVENDPNGEWECSLESCAPGVPSKNDCTRVNISLIQTEMWQSTSYFMQYNDFHRVQAHRAITYLQRSDYKQPFAHVVRQRGHGKICPFSASLNESDCWDIIADIFQLWNKQRLAC